ncbi:MAG: type II secretion system F family protein [Proteobacteria bacterium]|nr:type II secretion system F family protein [Pseudomonadota bacterium]
MAEWVWEARGRTGEMRKGIMDAQDAESVHTKLKQQHLSPTKVKKKGRSINISIGSPVADKELVIFVRQFATMIDAGLPLVQCLEILSAQGENKTFNAILRDVKNYVEQGATFSDALRRHPKVFDELFVNLVQAGEMGGILDTILNRLAVYIEKRVKLKRQVRSALVYPTSVMLIAVAVLVILLSYVIPSFESMFRDFGGHDSLPGLTRFVIGLSQGFLGSAHWIVLGIATVSGLFSYTYRLPKGKRFYHKAVLTAPVLGPVMRKIAVARFTRTLGTLLGSGVPILDALNIVAKSAGNVIVEEAIVKTGEGIRAGHTMVEPLAASKVFPSMVVQMIGVGEQTGALDQMLNKIADFYEEEVDVAVAGMTSLIEPIMMVGIGGMVGFMLIAMYMPIFDIAGKIKTH